MRTAETQAPPASLARLFQPHEPAPQRPSAQPERAAHADRDPVACALTRALDLPLAALRAATESLTHELGKSRVCALRADGVLREVERLGRNVRGLLDYTSAPAPHRMRCSLEEIVRSARAELATEQETRVIIARCEPRACLHADGVLLASCLRRVLENALEAEAQHVLLVARLVDGGASFSVLDDAPRGLPAGWRPSAFHTTKPNHLGLGLTLTQRDVELLSGRLEFLSTPSGETCVRITVPEGRSEEEIR